MLKNECIKTTRIYDKGGSSVRTSIVSHNLKHVGLVTSTVDVLMEGGELKTRWMSDWLPLGTPGRSIGL